MWTYILNMLRFIVLKYTECESCHLSQFSGYTSVGLDTSTLFTRQHRHLQNFLIFPN